MAPQVNITLSDRQLHFTLSHVDVSIANAIRRTALSDIITPVFIEENMNFITNTSRLHNEILKQRLACIPIHINDVDIKLENYVVEIIKNNDCQPSHSPNAPNNLTSPMPMPSFLRMI